MKSGIYQITNLVNMKSYVGSSIDIKHRFRAHRFHLKHNKHCNAHLQNAWNKYGEESFEFKILHKCEVKDLLSYEQKFIDQIKPQYNIRTLASSNYGVKYSAESKAKMSLTRLGKHHTLEAKQKISVGSIAKARPVHSIDPNNGLITEYISVTQAVEAGFNRNLIYLAIKRSRRHRQLYWSYTK